MQKTPIFYKKTGFFTKKNGIFGAKKAVFFEKKRKKYVDICKKAALVGVIIILFLR